MTKLYAILKDEETKEYEVINQEEAIANGYEQYDLEIGYDGKFYLAGFNPKEPAEHKNEIIRQKRQIRYENESDPIRLEYEEALARGDSKADKIKESWLDSKDTIRRELPYI